MEIINNQLINLMWKLPKLKNYYKTSTLCTFFP